MDRTEKFLDLYRQLERAGRKHFPGTPDNAPIIGRLGGLTILKEYKDDIEYCRVVRNFLVHTPRVKGVYPIEPSEEMNELLQVCIDRLNNPIKAMDYSIKLKNMYTATLSTKISAVTDYMNNYGFTHVPVLDCFNKLIGVFSDNAIYTYICENGTINIDKDTELRLIENFLPVHAHCQEYFAFMKSDVYLYEVVNLFKIDVRSMKKLACIFFTQNGKADEPIQGMMTPYSVLRDFEGILRI